MFYYPFLHRLLHWNCIDVNVVQVQYFCEFFHAVASAQRKSGTYRTDPFTRLGFGIMRLQPSSKYVEKPPHYTNKNFASKGCFCLSNLAERLNMSLCSICCPLQTTNANIIYMYYKYFTTCNNVSKKF
jgi:hypothetical protein